MEALAEKLDARLREWKPETAAEVRKRVAEIMELADQDALDIVQGLGSLPKTRLHRRLGRLSDEVMTQIKRVLAFALDFGRQA